MLDTGPERRGQYPLTEAQVYDFTNRLLHGAAMTLNLDIVDDDGSFLADSATATRRYHSDQGQYGLKLCFEADRDDQHCPPIYHYLLRRTELAALITAEWTPDGIHGLAKVASDMYEYEDGDDDDGYEAGYNPIVCYLDNSGEMVDDPSEAATTELHGYLATTHEYSIYVPGRESLCLARKDVKLAIVDDEGDKVFEVPVYAGSDDSDTGESVKIIKDGEAEPADISDAERQIADITIYDLTDMKDILVALGLARRRSALLRRRFRKGSGL